MLKLKVGSGFFAKQSYPIYMFSSSGDCNPQDLQNKLNSIAGGRQIIVVKDAHLAENKTIFENLTFNDTKVTSITLPKFGEAVKSFEVFEWLANKVLDLKPTRKTLLVAMGGGSVGDLVGFLASVMIRGIDFIQYPTTLLSMVDSSVGGKTAINTVSSKNMIGTFYKPKAVLCDTALLATLPEQEFLSGYAEALKYGLLWDRAFFNYLTQHEAHIKQGCNMPPQILNTIIYDCCSIKAKIVQKDFTETKGIRSLLNLGHTFGHGIEKSALYKNKIPHGIAVAFGMIMAAEISVKLGFLKPEELALIKKHYQNTGLKTHLQMTPEFAADMLQIMSLDKKNANQDFVTIARGQSVRKTINLVLLKQIGRAFNTSIEAQDIYNYLTNDYPSNANI